MHHFILDALSCDRWVSYTQTDTRICMSMVCYYLNYMCVNYNIQIASRCSWPSLKTSVGVFMDYN